LKIIIEYKDIEKIKILRLKIKKELKNRNIDFIEKNLDIYTHWLDIYFIDNSLIYNKSNTYLILKDDKECDLLFDEINKVFDYFFVFKEYFLVEKEFDWINFDGKYDVKTLNFYEVDMLEGNKHIFEDKQKMIDYISMRIQSCIDDKIDDIIQLREIKNKVYGW